MDENYILSYFNEREKEFLRRFENLKTNQEVEDIHQLRVEVKKIRSILQLLDHFPDNTLDSKAYHKMLRRLFRPAGRLREAQMNLEQLDNHEQILLTGYRRYLQERISKQTEKLNKAITVFDQNSFLEFNKQIRSRIGLFNTDAVRNYMEQFMQKQLDLINRLNQKKQKKKQIHKIRKHLKALGYVLNIAIGGDYNGDLKNLQVLVKETETLIGTWHDMEMLSRSLKKFTVRPAASDELHDINTLILKLQPEQTEILDLIRKNLDRLPEKIRGDQGNSEITITY